MNLTIRILWIYLLTTAQLLSPSGTVPQGACLRADVFPRFELCPEAHPLRARRGAGYLWRSSCKAGRSQRGWKAGTKRRIREKFRGKKR